MKLGGRIQAAIEVLTDIETRHTPATDALRDWGKSHRFAGSGDRNVIGHIVHDALRTKASVGYRMGDDSPRAIVVGTLAYHWGINAAELKAAFADDKHSPKPLTDKEVKALSGGRPLFEAEDHIVADVPEWLWERFEANFDDEAVEEGVAMSRRAPLDLRVNTLKANREDMLEKFSRFEAAPGPISHSSIRLDRTEREARMPNIQIEPEYQMGQVEIQDEASQVAARLIDARPGENVLDLCAGSGGKTLALAASMENTGKLYAFDVDKHRLAPIYQRLMRAGVENCEVIQPDSDGLFALTGKMDRVVVDAPCTGSGTWRRRPDAKWRLSEQALQLRLSEQTKVLDQAAPFVRDGGYLIYMTCSVLAEENEGQVYPFLERHPEFEIISAGELWEDVFGVDKPKPWSSDGCSLTMTPASTDTDGFYFAIMEKTG